MHCNGSRHFLTLRREAYWKVASTLCLHALPPVHIFLGALICTLHTNESHSWRSTQSVSDWLKIFGPNDVWTCPFRCPRTISQKSACAHTETESFLFPYKLFFLPSLSQSLAFNIYPVTRVRGILPFFAPPSTSSPPQICSWFCLWAHPAALSLPLLCLLPLRAGGPLNRIPRQILLVFLLLDLFCPVW